MCAAVLALFMGPLTFVEPASATPDPAKCGPDVFRKPDGSLYTCSFQDNFNGTELKDSRWKIESSDDPSGFSPERTCYLDSPENVFVRGGYLNLVGRIAAASSRCKAAYKTFVSNYSGGAVVSWERFSQAYGRFSWRARFPDTKEPAYWGNLWMSPQKNTYGHWPRSGEIDVAEYWTGDFETVHSSLHYVGNTRADTVWDCKVKNVGDFHVYTLEWTKKVMKFYNDDTLCFTRSWKPYMSPQDGRPFNKPFVLVMSQGLGDPYFQVSKKAPKMGLMQIDWVRVWK